jgi:DNA mismatch endonuclease (patch repair protein)
MYDGRCKMEDVIVSSECCKIPKTNREFWVNKIRRNKERDIEVQKQLAAMGWHCITIWECELKPKVREKTLESLVYTLNKIFLQDHSVRCEMLNVKGKKEDVRGEMAYSVPEEEPMMAAEEEEM